MFFTTAASAAALLAASLPGAHANLNQLAVAAGMKYFGSATDNGELSDSAYTAILSDANEFGQITPGNTQKWYYTEPQEGTFNYTQGDVVTDFAAKNGQILRCHNLVWYNQLPSWISSGSWTNATLTAVLQAHIASEVGHYKGQCYAWDVVNEALADDASFRSNIFYTTIGSAYIPIAFAAAAAADSSAKLYYNDYNIEYAGSKATAALSIVKMIQAYGAPIHGVGLQGHFIVGSTPTQATLTSALQAFTALGVEVAYTEVDVRFSSLPATASGLEQQATDYGNVVKACLGVDGCVGVTVWDFDDGYSWVPSTFSGAGDACLFWSNLTAKPAYYSVSSILAAAATGSVASGSTAATTAATTKSASSVATAVVSSSAGAAASKSGTTLSKVTTKASASSVVATSKASSNVAKVTSSSSSVRAASTSAAAAAATTSTAVASSKGSCAKAKRTVTMFA